MESEVQDLKNQEDGAALNEQATGLDEQDLSPQNEVSMAVKPAEDKMDENQKAEVNQKMDAEQTGEVEEVKVPRVPKKIGPEPVEAGVVYAHTQNVVVSASIHRPLPLVRLAAQLEGAEYNPEQFPGLILKITEPKASALLFSSGKVICTGTKSIAEAKRAIDAIIVMVEALGLKVTGKPDVEVTNIVASGSVGGRLNLNSIIFTFENTEYEPEQFPGLVYKMPDTHVTFLLFGTGRVVITGAKSQKEIMESVRELRRQLIEAGELEK